MLHAGQSPDALALERAQRLAEQGLRDSAVSELRLLLGDYPHHYLGWLALARLQDRSGRSEAALCACRKALAGNPGWSAPCVLSADVLEGLGRCDEAARVLDECVPTAVEGERERLRVRAAGLRSRAGSGGAAEGPVDAVALDTVPPAPSRTPEIDALFRKAVEQYEGRNYDGALATIRRVIAAQPDHGGAYYYGGLIRRRRGENDLAKINFAKGLRYPELGYNAHYYLGRICEEEGDYAGAVSHMRAYLRATSHEAGKREAERLIARYLALAGGAPEAAPSGTDTAQSRPPATSEGCDLPMSWILPYLAPALDSAGVVSRLPAMQNADNLLRQGRWAEAAGVLDEWIEAADTLAGTWALYNLGVCRLRIGAAAGAGDAFRAFLARVSGHRDEQVVRMLDAAATLLDGSAEQAERKLRALLRSVREAPWRASALELLGDACARQERWDAAQRAYEDAAASAPPGSGAYSRARYGQGLMLLARGKLPQALSVLAGVAGDTAGPRAPDACYRIAETYSAQGAADKALAAFRRAVETYPEFLETPWGLYQIRCMAERLGDAEGASKAREELRSRFPSDYWARQRPPAPARDAEQSGTR